MSNAEPSTDGLLNGSRAPKKMRTVVHLSLCDALPAYGPIVDMTFSLARNGVRTTCSFCSFRP